MRLSAIVLLLSAALASAETEQESFFSNGEHSAYFKVQAAERKIESSAAAAYSSAKAEVQSRWQATQTIYAIPTERHVAHADTDESLRATDDYLAADR